MALINEKLLIKHFYLSHAPEIRRLVCQSLQAFSNRVDFLSTHLVYADQMTSNVTLTYL